MHGGVTAGRPTRALPHVLRKFSVIDIPNVNLAPADARPLNLGMAPQTEIRVSLDEQLGIN